MAKKKNISKEDVISYYMEYVLEQGKKPNSVYAFAKDNNFEESEFYQFFGGFEAVEKNIFKTFFDNTILALEKSKDYDSFEPRNKLLSFYFTFFEILTANRSYVLSALDKHKGNLKTNKLLSELKVAFYEYIYALEIELIDLQQEELNSIQNKGLQGTAWIQLLLTLKFWMDDTSPSFEKTDIYIEKSVNTSFDVLNVMPLKSLIDFGKFIYKEKIRMN